MRTLQNLKSHIGVGCFFLIWSFAYADLNPSSTEPPKETKQENQNFSYRIGPEVDGSQQYREEERSPDGVVKGSYGFRTPHGSFREVKYIADSGGFRAHVTSNEVGVQEKNPASVNVVKVDSPELLQNSKLQDSSPKESPKHPNEPKTKGCSTSKSANLWPYAFFLKLLTDERFRPIGETAELPLAELNRLPSFSSLPLSALVKEGVTTEQPSGYLMTEDERRDTLQKLWKSLGILQNRPTMCNGNQPCVTEDTTESTNIGYHQPHAGLAHELEKRGTPENLPAERRSENDDVYLVQNIFAKRLSGFASGGIYPAHLLPNNYGNQAQFRGPISSFNQESKIPEVHDDSHENRGLLFSPFANRNQEQTNNRFNTLRNPVSTTANRDPPVPIRYDPSFQTGGIYPWHLVQEAFQQNQRGPSRGPMVSSSHSMYRSPVRSAMPTFSSSDDVFSRGPVEHGRHLLRDSAAEPLQDDKNQSQDSFQLRKGVVSEAEQNSKVITRNFLNGQLVSTQSKYMPIGKVKPQATVGLVNSGSDTKENSNLRWPVSLGQRPFPSLHEPEQHRKFIIPEVKRPLYDSRGVEIKPEDAPLHLHRFVPPSRAPFLPKSWQFSIPRPVPPRTIVQPSMNFNFL